MRKDRSTPTDTERAPHAGIDITLLGRFAVRVDGEVVAEERWAGLRPAQLVQLLALADGHRLPREQVIDTLWPHLDPEAGAANLRKAAHHARQALGRHDTVVLQGGNVALAPTLALNVDAQRFETIARAALASASGPGDPAACAEAAARYGGELLPAARYEPWAEAPRERLRALQVALLRAAGDWQRLVELDPADEPSSRELMRRDLAAGNRSAAIRAYARLRAALQQSLGVAPEVATTVLYRSAIEGLAAGTGPTLVGREVERAQIDAWLAMPPRARPWGVRVRGSAGLGKSALGREVAAAARAAGWTVAGAAAGLSGRPYGALVAVAEQLLLADAQVLDAIGAPARSVLALLTPLAAPGEGLPGALGRHQVIGALRRLLLAAADGGDVMLQIDDAHRLDDAEADVLLHLAASGPPLFVWTAARATEPPSPLERAAARLGPTPRLPAIDLDALAAAEARDLAARSATVPLASETVERIVRQAAGIPFAIVELARCAGAPAGRLPADAAQAITDRLCDVPDAARELLCSLALADDAFDAATAAALAPAGESQAFAVLDAALVAGVLVVEDTRFRFRHELVRLALVDPVPPHRRLKLHREIAQRLADADRIDPPPALVARHWLAGASVREAVPWLLDAAHAAWQVAAFSDVLQHLGPVLVHDPRHAEALRLRAEALDALGDPQAVPAYHAAADADGGARADDFRAKAALAQVKLGDPQGGVQALQGLAPTTTEGRLAEALAYSGAAALGAVDPALGSAKSAEARRLALATGDRAALAIASWAHAAAAHARGELHQTVQMNLRDTRHLPALAVRVFDGQLCMTQRFLYGARPYAEVIDFAQQLADEARRLGSPRGEAFGVTIRGEAELLAGDLDAAEHHLGQGVSLHRAIAAATGESFALQRLAEVSMHRGQVDEAHERLAAALDLARQTDVGYHLLDRIYGTRIALADLAGDGRAALDEAEAAVRGPLETCPGCRITFAVPAAIAAARAHDLPRAEALASHCAYLAQVVMRLPAWHAAHAEVLGHLAAARGEPAAAGPCFATAAAGFRAAGQPLDAARCEAAAAVAPGRA